MNTAWSKEKPGFPTGGSTDGHAATPHNAGMKNNDAWEGAALPNPPQGYGQTGFPHTPNRLPASGHSYSRSTRARNSGGRCRVALRVSTTTGASSTIR